MVTPGEHPAGFFVEAASGHKRVQRDLVRLERRGWTGRVEGMHQLVPFPVLSLIVGGDCLPKLTALIATGAGPAPNHQCYGKVECGGNNSLFTMVYLHSRLTGKLGKPIITQGYYWLWQS